MDEVKYTAELTGSLKLSSTGVWIHNGSPFQNQKLIDLFFRSIIWDPEEKRYLLRIGSGCAKFECEDTAYFVNSFDDTSLPWIVNLSDNTAEAFCPDTLAVGSQGQIYCTIKGSHKARLSRSAHQHLLLSAVSNDEIKIGDRVYRLHKCEG